MKTYNPRLYIVADRTSAQNRWLEAIVEEAIQGGATMVQLRDKESSQDEVIALGRKLHSVTQKYNVPLIINDNIHVALAIDANGLHIGQDDMPVREGRRRLGSDKILGVSVKTVEEALRAEKEGADYLGVGPIFATRTKHDAGEPIGLNAFSQIAKSVSIPAVAIGGITKDNAASVMSVGAAGIAVVSAVMAAKDPKKAARELCEQIRIPKHEIRNNIK